MLLTEQIDAERRLLLTQARTEGLNERHVPHQILTIEIISLLGSGKVDDVNARRLAEEKARQTEAI